MAVLNKESIIEVPSQQIEGALRQFTLFYRHGVNPRCEKGFFFKGDIRAANERARKHCEIMGYKFIFVRPTIVDLDEEEKQQNGKVGLHTEHIPEQATLKT